MRVLVIPDVHLKPYMFVRAAELMRNGVAEKAVCLMDIADDWKQEYNLDLYMQTYDAAIAFAREFPDTLWCYGNHDLCYPWQKRESGYSVMAAYTVCTKLDQLKCALPDISQIAYIHKIDNVLFMHGGLIHDFVYAYTPYEIYDNADAVVRMINTFESFPMWQDASPIWYRPQLYDNRLYHPDELLQVVGHTPVQSINQVGNVVSCDVFSLDRNRHPMGSQEYLLIDTESWKWEGVK